ncbi:MAG: 16S rRNA (cytosine(967)-C(5))-methyltransferase RsmB [Methylophilaceae bacterium]|nr:16S rRNA (cytosine(967)-C(5))-methyltransferase RsmB [Methylophilaceae bacterium]
MQNSQLLSAKVLESLLDGANLDKSFEVVFRENKNNKLEIQEAQIKALTYGSVRFLGKSRFIINYLVKNKIENRTVECLIHIALYQLSQEKFNDFTIVNQAVDAAKKIDFRKSKFVNAILRNYLRSKDDVYELLNKEQAAKYSYQNWWINKVKDEFKSDWEAILEIGNQHPPLTLRVNKRRITMQKYCEILIEHGLEHKEISNTGLIINKPLSINDIPGFMEGYISVQDFGAQIATELLDIKKGQKILDACAAPGGKTCNILESEDVDVTALEINKERADKISDNLNRLGLNANVIHGSLSNDNLWWKGEQFDRILLDVPCSASGIVRRHVDIKWLRQMGDLKKFSEMQYHLLKSAWPLIKSGGKLLYVTCSIFSNENRDVIERFKKEFRDAKEIDLIYLNTIKHIKNQLVPSENHDGLFYVLLQKN